jgi:hypothetical protein
MSNFKVVVLAAIIGFPSLASATCYQAGNVMTCNGQPYYLQQPQVNIYQRPANLPPPQTTFPLPQGADISGSYMRGVQAGQEMRLRAQQMELQRQQIEMNRRMLEQQANH